MSGASVDTVTAAHRSASGFNNHGEMPERFSLVLGGSFHALLRRAGLVAEDSLPTGRAAFWLAFIAWLIPILLVCLQEWLDPVYDGHTIFTDFTVHSRFLIAIWVMIATERIADARVSLLIRQFPRSGLIASSALPAFVAAVLRADRRTSSRWVEPILLVVAVIWSFYANRFASEVSAGGWEGSVVDGVVFLSWAGNGSTWLSTPFFLFLMLRWVWRFIAWATLLFTISRLPLQLMPLHPDRAGGLGFLSIFPSVFSGLVFGLSCVIASSLFKAFVFLGHTQQIMWMAIGVWVGFIAMLFLGPLLVFVRPLYLARERALLQYGRLAQQHHLAFHRKWIEADPTGSELMGVSDSSSVSDVNASVQAVHAMRSFPIERGALVMLLLAASLPFFPVMASQMPLNELLALMLGTLL